MTYIRKAVELADGWDYYADDDHDQGWLDMLAAQLVRQVDALDGFNFVSGQDCYSYVWRACDDKAEMASYGPDRTMNTIKAIVASGVLDNV